jgi:hypothetical protein
LVIAQDEPFRFVSRKCSGLRAELGREESEQGHSDGVEHCGHDRLAAQKSAAPYSEPTGYDQSNPGDRHGYVARSNLDVPALN